MQTNILFSLLKSERVSERHDSEREKEIKLNEEVNEKKEEEKHATVIDVISHDLRHRQP